MGFAQSERVEMGWDGNSGYFEHQTSTSDHPLQYFLSVERQHEFLRAETDDCADPSMCREVALKASLTEIGAWSGKKVFQIVYSFTPKTENADGNSGSPPRPYWKAIIAETSLGQYREIFLLRNEGGFWTWPPSTAGVVNSGDSKILFTSDATTSRDLWCTGAFWVVQESRLAPVDFSAVTEALDKAVPAGASAITPMCAAVSLEKLEVRSVVKKSNAECRTCGMEGSVIVKFKLNGARAEPVSSRLAQD